MTERSDASHTRRFVAYFVERAHTKLTLQTQRVLGAYVGLTPRQWWIIADMMAERPRTATELASLADIDKGLLSRNLKASREMGLVEMARNTQDQRQQIISLTEAGRAKHDETIPTMRARNDWLTHDISEEELDIAMRVLSKPLPTR